MKNHEVKKMKNAVLNALVEWERHKKKHNLVGDLNLGFLIDFTDSFIQEELKRG